MKVLIAIAFVALGFAPVPTFAAQPPEPECVPSATLAYHILDVVRHNAASQDQVQEMVAQLDEMRKKCTVRGYLAADAGFAKFSVAAIYHFDGRSDWPAEMAQGKSFLTMCTHLIDGTPTASDCRIAIENGESDSHAWSHISAARATTVASKPRPANARTIGSGTCEAAVDDGAALFVMVRDASVSRTVFDERLSRAKKDADTCKDNEALSVIRALQDLTLATHAHDSGGIWALSIMSANLKFSECATTFKEKHYVDICERFGAMAKSDARSW